jgi:hypothetical protein
MRAKVARCLVTGPPSLVELVQLASGDLADAGAVTQLDLAGDPGAAVLSVVVELAPDDGSRDTPGG